MSEGVSQQTLNELQCTGATKCIVPGHELTDVSCRHRSRWIWWPKPGTELGEWKQVVLAPDCDCGDPPLPFKSRFQMHKYLNGKGKV